MISSMRISLFGQLLICSLVLAFASLPVLADDEATNPQKQEAAGSIGWTKPAGWASEKPANRMRQAQYRLPASGTDAEDGELVVYFFGGRAGGVEANLDRWMKQFQRPDGSPCSRDDAAIKNQEVAGLKVTVVDLAGRYIAAVRPGAPQRHDKPGWRMLAAVVTTPEGNYFFKLLGPQATLERWQASFDKLVESLHKTS